MLFQKRRGGWDALVTEKVGKTGYLMLFDARLTKLASAIPPNPYAKGTWGGLKIFLTH
jgi:hypothetical protein